MKKIVFFVFNCKTFGHFVMNILIYDFWKQSSPKEAKEVIDFLLKQDNLQEYLEILLNVSELSDYFYRYCWILKDEPQLEELVNRPEFPTRLLFNLMYSSFGKYVKSGNVSNDFFLATWAKHLTSEQSYRLLSEEPEIEKDLPLKIYLLANLDAKKWESFFEAMLLEEKGISEVISLFENIDSSQRKKIFYRNPTLYQYLRMILVVETSEVKTEFLSSLESTLNEIYTWEEYAKEVRSKFDLVSEKNKSPRERNESRLTLILKEAKKLELNKAEEFLEYLTIQQILIDEVEFEIVLGLLKNQHPNE